MPGGDGILRVFISHRVLRQEGWATWVAAHLAELGVESFRSEADIVAGEAWEEVVRRAIGLSDYVIFLLDDEPMSRWQSRERGMADAHGIPCVAALLPGFSRRIPRSLADRQALDLRPAVATIESFVKALHDFGGTNE